MIRILILLSPVYFSLFWIIAIQINKKTLSAPAKFLNVFLLIAVLCFFGQFLFFAPYPDIFPYWEPVLAYLGSLAFPVYYIYFRLLTVDDHFSFRKHMKYLIIPVLIATIYTVGIILSPFDQYKAWLYNETLFPNSPYIQFLGIMRKIVKLTFVVLLLMTYFSNRALLKKYAHKAEQYYSNIRDAKFNNARILNYNLIFVSAGCLIAHMVGRKLLFPHEIILDIIWLIFAVSLYSIGYMGFHQKSINPTFETNEEETKIVFTVSEPNLSQKIILEKLLDIFEKEKIYLNSNLNITEVVQRVGSNRTYVSAIINQQYNLNFCSFVNNYRLAELERNFIENPSVSNQLLAEKSGFGSFNSMKRAIESRTSKSVSEWKNEVLEMRLNTG